MRLKIYRLIIISLFCFIFAGLFYVQVVRGKYYYGLSTNNRIRVVPLESYRGRIFDRHGELLADNRPSYNVMVVPQEVEDSDSLFSYISKITNIDQEELFKTFQARRFTPFAPVSVADDVKKDIAIVLEENRYRFPGLLIEETFKRFYPQKKNSAHVVGYVGKVSQKEAEQINEYGYTPRMMIGKLGVEKFYDHFLSGTNGGMQIEVNSRGEQVRLLSLKESIKGQDIALTLDSDLQRYATELMDGKTGAIVVMETKTGEILSMVSSPTYDPNIFIEDSQLKQLRRVLAHRRSPILNRGIKGAYPPGSVFKIPVAIAALDSNKIHANTTFECPGFHMVGEQRFGCLHSHGGQNLIESIVHSCNVYFYHLGIKLGADLMHKYAKLLGLGELTNIDLPFERKGNIPQRSKWLASKKRWYTGDSLNFAIGQGRVLATPLQLTRMMSTIAQNGMEVQPHLIKTIGTTPFRRYPIKQTIKIAPKTFNTVKKAMHGVVADYSGTAHVLNLKGLYVAGKTGTAQSSGKKKSHAWFAGYARGDHRELAFCVFVEHGGSSQNANLIARQLLMKMQEDNIL